DEGALLAFLHILKCFIPAADDGACADAEYKRHAFAIGAVERRSIEQPAFIVSDDLVANRRRGGSDPRSANDIAQTGGELVCGPEDLCHFHLVVGAQLRLLFVERLAHRAVDGPPWILAPQYARAGHERGGEKEDTEQKQ